MRELYSRPLARIRRASWMSFGMMVTRLAWIAQRLVSSKRPTRYASAAFARLLRRPSGTGGRS